MTLAEYLDRINQNRINSGLKPISKNKNSDSYRIAETGYYKYLIDKGLNVSLEVFKKYPFLNNYIEIKKKEFKRPKSARFLLQLQKLENSLTKTTEKNKKIKILNELILNYHKAERLGFYGNPGSSISELKMENDIDQAKKNAGISSTLSASQLKALKKSHELMKKAQALQKNQGTKTVTRYNLPLQKALKIVSKK